jgi:uncharacterized membrane protein
MLKVLELAIARIDTLPEDKQRAAAEALDHIATATPIGPAETHPGVDLKWPASAIWRPGEPAINTIGLADLKSALEKGWADFAAVPSYAIFLCIIYPIIGLILFRLSFGYEVLPLVFPLLAGFTLIGPFAAVGLYEISRRRELGLDASPSHVLDIFHLPSLGSIVALGVTLAAIFFAWLAVAKLIYEQIFGLAVPASVGEFFNQVLTTPEGRQLILAGNAVGFLFAVLVLVISVVSFPMLVDRNVGTMTAVRTSIRAVLENPVTMAVWGLIVAASLLLGSLPFFLGLAVVFPILGHATWHLYRKVVAH